MMVYSEEECLQALNEAAEILGQSPTMNDYSDLDLSPSSPSTIAEKFGGWNKAKLEAGLETMKQKNKVTEKPDDVNLPEGKKWEDISSYQRYYYKNRQKEKERTKRRTEELKRWFKRYKENLQCQVCGENHRACLDFHHTGDKEKSVTELVSRMNTSKETIKQEIEKCDVLCANCHRKRHFEN